MAIVSGVGAVQKWFQWKLKLRLNSTLFSQNWLQVSVLLTYLVVLTCLDMTTSYKSQRSIFVGFTFTNSSENFQIQWKINWHKESVGVHWVQVKAPQLENCDFILCSWLTGYWIILHFRGADANKNANNEDIEMKTNLVDNKGDPNQTEPWSVRKFSAPSFNKSVLHTHSILQLSYINLLQ